MTKDFHKKLTTILTTAKWDWRTKLKELMEEEGIDPATVDSAPKTGTRTLSQNSALHLDCKLIAEKLNEAGKDMKIVLKQEVQIPWSTESVKEYIFKPIMKALYQKESTTELQKGGGEIEKIHDVIMRELGEKHGIEFHDFPSDEKKQLENLSGVRLAQTKHL
jgi:hypothetical protein